MEKSVQSKFKFLGFRIDHSDITFKAKPEKDGGKMEISIVPSGVLEDRTFKLILAVAVNDEEKKYIDVHITATGEFEVSDLSKASLGFLTVNAPAILFPHIRAYVASLSALSGYGTILMPALNLTGLQDTLRKNIKGLENIEKAEA